MITEQEALTMIFDGIDTPQNVVKTIYDSIKIHDHLKATIDEFRKHDNINLTAVMVIFTYQPEIEVMIANGAKHMEIITAFNIPIQEASFTTMWHAATGISYIDVPKKSKLELNLKQKGYTSQQIQEIVECL